MLGFGLLKLGSSSRATRGLNFRSKALQNEGCFLDDSHEGKNSEDCFQSASHA